MKGYKWACVTKTTLFDAKALCKLLNLTNWGCIKQHVGSDVLASQLQKEKTSFLRIFFDHTHVRARGQDQKKNFFFLSFAKPFS